MKFFLKRLGQMFLVLFCITFLVYGLMFLAPGDPAQKKLEANGISVSQEVLEQTRQEMGLDRPFLVQYGSWLWGVIRGDLGTSYKDDTSVASKLFPAMKNTLILTGLSMLVSVIVSAVLGILSAVYQNSFWDGLIRLLSFIGNALPNFLLAVLLMYFFCIRLKWFSVIAGATPKGLFLPVLSLSIPLTGRFTRQFRAQMLEELSKPYVSGARSRGVSERIILCRNVLHNALPGVLTLIGVSAGVLMGGSVVVENIFSWNGMGKMAMDAITNRDYPVLLAFVLWSGVIVVVINLITDLAYHWIDPRIELSGETG